MNAEVSPSAVALRVSTTLAGGSETLLLHGHCLELRQLKVTWLGEFPSACIASLPEPLDLRLVAEASS
jgi:hypothetical protein